MRKNVLAAAAMAVIFVVMGSGCRFWCDRYCDRRDDCDRPRRFFRDRDDCRNDAPPPAVRYGEDDCN